MAKEVENTGDVNLPEQRENKANETTTQPLPAFCLRNLLSAPMGSTLFCWLAFLCLWERRSEGQPWGDAA